MAAGSGPDAHIHVSDVYFVDDIAVEEGTFSGTHDGVLHTPSEDMPPTGRAISVPYIHVLRYRDGLHVSFNLVFDRLLMLAASCLPRGGAVTRAQRRVS